VAQVQTVNLGSKMANPHKDTGWTGINKQPQTEPVQVRAPGVKTKGLGSGLVGDFIGDQKHHGGDDQAVYAVAREDLDRWAARFGRELPNGFFGENLTTVGIDVNEARLGERWRIGETVELVVTVPRIPCSTFRGWVDERAWLKTFTADARPGTYLSVATPGAISSGDPIEVVHRPDHDVTVSMTFRALTTERTLIPRLAAARDDLVDELREEVDAYAR
jgi:MOSC domain-containing protein YiiM